MPALALTHFRRRRGESMETLMALPPADWQRGGEHPVRGRLSIDMFVAYDGLARRQSPGAAHPSPGGTTLMPTMEEYATAAPRSAPAAPHANRRRAERRDQGPGRVRPRAPARRQELGGQGNHLSSARHRGGVQFPLRAHPRHGHRPQAGGLERRPHGRGAAVPAQRRGGGDRGVPPAAGGEHRLSPEAHPGAVGQGRHASGARAG